MTETDEDYGDFIKKKKTNKRERKRVIKTFTSESSRIGM